MEGNLIYTVISTAIATLGMIASFVNRFQGIMTKIALRIEKDTKDGIWTNEEREKMAIDIYFEEVYPKLPPDMWALRVMPRFLMEKILKWSIKRICALAKQFKDAVDRRKKNIELNRG